MIIVIEGADASGKATQSKLLAEKLGGTRFSFPSYESPTGKLILAHLKKEWWCVERDTNGRGPVFSVDADDQFDARVFQSLQTVNRLESLPDIQAAVAAGKHVVMDRYWQSACVYGALDGLDEVWLRLVQEKPMPPADVNILIDVPVEEGFKRRPERRDRYESNRAFLEKVRTKYLEVWWGVDAYHDSDGACANFESDELWAVARDGWYVVNGTHSVEDVHQSILEIVAKKQTGVL